AAPRALLRGRNRFETGCSILSDPRTQVPQHRWRTGASSFRKAMVACRELPGCLVVEMGSAASVVRARTGRSDGFALPEPRGYARGLPPLFECCASAALRGGR